jgi:NAD(P)-dependent dehydrogenase (short-subunit alcohol dehydrogenase family)
MRDFSGKTAFVTGAAQGIGLGICNALAKVGVNLAMADIEPAALAKARESFANTNIRAMAFPLDVSDGAAFDRVAGEVEREFGKVHILINNAGVVAPVKPLSQFTMAEWDWLISVNLYGAIHGIRAFLPLIRKHGEGGHVANTASIGGLQVREGRGTGSYAATKFAVAALTESLSHELAGTNIGVSVLCPAAVRTGIYASGRHRPARFGGPIEPVQDGRFDTNLADGLHPDEVGERLVQAIRDNEFFVFTHEEPRAWIEERHRRMMAGFDSVARYNRAKAKPR